MRLTNRYNLFSFEWFNRNTFYCIEGEKPLKETYDVYEIVPNKKETLKFNYLSIPCALIHDFDYISLRCSSD